MTETKPPRRSAIIAGATGLIGHHLLQNLLHSPQYEQVYVLSRRELPTQHPKLKQVLIDFNKLAQMQELPAAQDVYCCLGTTMKKAGSREEFRKVDYTYPLNLAKLAGENGAEQFLLVSALGANERSLFFYNRIKGQLEAALSKLNTFGAIHIFRPSLLLGERNETRTGEKLGSWFMQLLKPLLRGPLKNIRPIQATTVATAMPAAALANRRGVQLYPTAQIKYLARNY